MLSVAAIGGSGDAVRTTRALHSALAPALSCDRQQRAEHEQAACWRARLQQSGGAAHGHTALPSRLRPASPHILAATAAGCCHVQRWAVLATRVLVGEAAPAAELEAVEAVLWLL